MPRRNLSPVVAAGATDDTILLNKISQFSPPLDAALVTHSCSFCEFQEVPDENYDLPYHQNDTNGDAVMIKMDVPGREEPSFPKEKWKTFIGE